MVKMIKKQVENMIYWPSTHTCTNLPVPELSPSTTHASVHFTAKRQEPK